MLKINQTITTLQLRDQINKFRLEEGETPIRNADFMIKVRDELDVDDSTYALTVGYKMNSRGTKSAYLNLNKDQCLLVGMRESKIVRRKVLDWITKASEALKEEASVMRKLDEAMMLMKQDKDIASACGRGLFEWKEQRKIHMDRVDELHKDVQILLNFGDSKNGQS